MAQAEACARRATRGRVGTVHGSREGKGGSSDFTHFTPSVHLHLASTALRIAKTERRVLLSDLESDGCP